jgi:hypothetical protein
VRECCLVLWNGILCFVIASPHAHVGSIVNWDGGFPVCPMYCCSSKGDRIEKSKCCCSDSDNSSGGGSVD